SPLPPGVMLVIRLELPDVLGRLRRARGACTAPPGIVRLAPSSQRRGGTAAEESGHAGRRCCHKRSRHCAADAGLVDRRRQAPPAAPSIRPGMSATTNVRSPDSWTTPRFGTSVVNG